MTLRIVRTRRCFVLGFGVERWYCATGQPGWHAKVYLGIWTVLIGW